MTDESYSFTAAKTRLDEIVTQVRKKDTSLEKSLDLLEEGVRLANVCTELIDHTDWVNAPTASGEALPTDVDTAEASAETVSDADASAAAEAAPVREEDAASVDDELEAASGSRVPTSEEVSGDVWSEDEAWADESDDDPSGGDEGYSE